MACVETPRLFLRGWRVFVTQMIVNKRERARTSTSENKMPLTLPVAFVDTKTDRIKRCINIDACGNFGNFYCHRCRRLSKKLCRRYHNANDPAEELHGRLLYEYVFDYMTERDLLEGSWKVIPTATAADTVSSRDQGHLFRLRKLSALAGYRMHGL
jgi:hypothetical protein